MAKTVQAWLKAIGTGEDRVPDAWVEKRPDFLRHVRFPETPSGIRSGDILLYYASGHQRLCAIAKASMDGEDCPFELAIGQDQWPYNLPVQVIIAIPTISLSLPYAILGLPPQAVMRMTHRRLADTEYQKALDALLARIAL
jgi:hypothetical protein